MKDKYAADTMALVLRLERRRLPQSVKHLFEEVEQGKGTLSIPAMVLAEIGYLSEKNRIDTSLQEALLYCDTYTKYNSNSSFSGNSCTKFCH